MSIWKKNSSCWPISQCSHLNSSNSSSRILLAFRAGLSLSVLGIAKRKGWNLLTMRSSTRVRQKGADEMSKVLTRILGQRQTLKERLRLGVELSKRQSLTCSLKWIAPQKPSFLTSSASASPSPISLHWARKDLPIRVRKKIKPRGC